MPRVVLAGVCRGGPWGGQLHTREQSYFDLIKLDDDHVSVWDRAPVDGPVVTVRLGTYRWTTDGVGCWLWEQNGAEHG
jgi:hypothetical protein